MSDTRKRDLFFLSFLSFEAEFNAIQCNAHGSRAQKVAAGGTWIGDCRMTGDVALYCFFAKRQIMSD